MTPALESYRRRALAAIKRSRINATTEAISTLENDDSRRFLFQVVKVVSILLE
jgi:hypothetical protein